MVLQYLYCSAQADTYGQAASNLVDGSNLEQTIQQIMDIGGGNWDKETVTRALRAAYNNPERAVDYLYSVSLNSGYMLLQSLPRLAINIFLPSGYSRNSGSCCPSGSFSCKSGN